jgi:gliding motility-associated-like protein
MVSDSAKIEVRSFNGFSINPPLSACVNEGAQLWASGGDLFSWSPAGALNNPALPDPFANPTGSTTFTVTITDTLCGFVRSLSTNYTVLPLPVVKAARSNDIDCITPQSILNASGASNYVWSPSTSLNNGTIASPIATPTTTTQYVVKGTDRSGCINYDSVTVKVTNLNKSGYAMATAFTPNNDGVNDCYGIKYWGTITELQFSIYNRWGQRIFYTTNPSACWDGNFRGVPQDPNVFVYMIRANTVCGGVVFKKGTFALIR